MGNWVLHRSRASVASALFALVLSVAGTHVEAQPREYMKKLSPDELYVDFFQEEDCPWALEHVVDGALVRSRIRRKPLWSYNETVLFVNVFCIEARSRILVYDVDVSFGTFVRAESGAQYSFDSVTINAGQYGGLGATGLNDSGRQSLENNLGREVERALVDYLRSNFDL